MLEDIGRRAKKEFLTAAKANLEAAGRFSDAAVGIAKRINISNH